MKKWIALLMAGVLCLSLCSCIEVDTSTPDGDNSGGKDPDRIYIDTPSSKFDKEAVKNQCAVKTYSYDNGYWTYAFVEITNNSEFDLEVSVDVKFYNEEGALIGAEDATENAVQAGTSVLLYFMPDEKISSMEYELSVSEEDFYECVVKDLSYESVTAKDKEIVSVTNNGEEAAEFVECSMLFFKNDKVVEFTQHYFNDDDYELKPGKTITKEMECYEAYDSYKIYFTGHRS